jgi:hypothetical protein
MSALTPLAQSGSTHRKHGLSEVTSNEEHMNEAQASEQIPSKRLRVVKKEYSDVDEDYNDMDMDMDMDNDKENDGPPEEFFPDDDYDQYNNNSQSSNLSWTDQTDTATNFSQLSNQQLQKWSRKPLPKNFNNKKDLHFQWLDIDMTQNPSPLKRNPNPSRDRVVGAQTGTVPLIRIYGVTEDGHSISTFLHGYTPYGYFALPEGYSLDFKDGDTREKNAVLGKIRQILNDKLCQAKAAKRGGNNNTESGDLVQGVQYIEDRKSIMGYSTAHTKFLKVYLQMPTLVPTLKRIMEEGVMLPHILKSTDANGSSSGNGNRSVDSSDNNWGESLGSGQSYQPFECNVPFVLRFMIDEDIDGAGWITLPKGTYQLRTEENRLKTTHCQVSLSTIYIDLDTKYLLRFLALHYEKGSSLF